MAFGFPEMSLITAAEISPAKCVPSCFKKVYSISLVVPSLNGTPKIVEEPMVIFLYNKVEGVSSEEILDSLGPDILKYRPRRIRDMAFQVSHKHAIGRCLHKCSVFLLAGLQCRFSPLSFADVGDHHGNTERFAAFVSDHESVVPRWNYFPLARKHRQFTLPISLSHQDRESLCLSSAIDFIWIVNGYVLAGTTMRLVLTQHSTQCWIHVHKMAAEVSHAESLAGGFSKLPEDPKFLVGGGQLGGTLFDFLFKLVVGLLQRLFGPFAVGDVLDGAKH